MSALVRSVRTVGALAALLMLIAAACGYSPAPENGKQDCGPVVDSQRCVGGYYCALDGKCWQDGTGPGRVTGGAGSSGTAGAGGGGGSATAGRGGAAGSVGGAAGSGGTAGSGTAGSAGTAGAGSGGTSGAGGTAGTTGTAGRGGTGGTAGTTGIAGRGGTGGTAGAGGTAGTTGTAGRGGSGGVAGTAGTVGRDGAGGTGPATYTLTISAPTGGKVTDSAGNINCGTVCTHAGYAPGTTVTLTAMASTGYQFTAWSGGGCSGNNATCVVTMNSDVTVTATFTSLHVLTVNVIDDNGCPSAYGASATAAPNGMTGCTLSNATAASPMRSCIYNILNGASVNLVAMTQNQSVFDGPPALECGNNSTISGNCQPGNMGTCMCAFTMTAARTVSVYVCRP